MILRELVKGEHDPLYKQLEVANTGRQFGFLLSLIEIVKAKDQQWLSQSIIKALNYHAIACLHDYAGEYRPCDAYIGESGNGHKPPPPHAVRAQMDHLVNYVNANWHKDEDPAKLAAFVLWRLNHIHPFINGNGRTARALAYFVICLKSGGPLPGKKTLPELLTDNRDICVAALKTADQSYTFGPKLDLTDLSALITQLLNEQLGSIEAEDI